MTIQQQPFGSTPHGIAVDLYTLTNAHGMAARIMTYGGTVVSLTAPDRDSALADVVLGFDTLDQYRAFSPYFGALIGRIGNRIKDAKFTLNGIEYRVTPNNGNNQLHGGRIGYDKVVWDAKIADNALHLSYLSPDGEEGFPGALQVNVAYTLTDDNALRIDYDAVPNQDTIVNLTNHAYFNLAGAGNILDHALMIDADAFTVIDRETVTTGEIRAVAGTPFDFREPAAIGLRIAADDDQIRYGMGYDHNFVLNNAAGLATKSVSVYEPITGRVMDMYTTAPGVQLYTGNQMDDRNPIRGKAGNTYGRFGAFCLEAQTFPNAINYPHFPSPIVRAGDHYRQTTIYAFSAR